MTTLDNILAQIKLVKRPIGTDTINIDGHLFKMKLVKSLLLTLKFHAYSAELDSGYLVIKFQNKLSTGVFRFKDIA